MVDLWQMLALPHGFQVLNRNARKPRKANHGKRPCSSVQRKYRTKTFGKKGK